ncbi:peroxidase [Spirosoma sp. HMF4905]|uniref:Peroxidase n=1 Tax=Spirosoma arboris TaxID=2682092 RepID=A0A7K1SNL1_9BACT|nr:Dyp-type peroxidase domain-containing protein [Spirosoma arboris]MVM35253.1 peroxidase [Spirosoma arboris]
MVLLTDKEIDIRDLKYFKFLSNLQGNILKGHGRNHTNNIFIQFNKGKEKEVKAWLKSFTEDHVTSALTQLKETELFKRNNISGGIFSAVYVSASGYKYLQGTTTLPTTFEKPFVDGMKNAQLNDPSPATWDPGLADDIHLMILIADPDSDKVSLLTKSILDLILDNGNNNKNPLGKILTIEYGSAIRNVNGDGLEHFGYVDGISQPLFLKDDVASYNQSLVPTYTPTANKFDVSAELGLVIVKDPFVNDPQQDTYGSYFVFRKLEEKVRGFKINEKLLATSLGLKGDDRERAGAMIIGRFEDGTPVTLSPEAGIYQSGIANNFNYDEDTKGAKCPFHSHIRKSNPRHPGDNKHVMARRGITYGQRDTNTDIDPDFAQMPTGGVGLLFMSFQHSLINQFEFIQKTWVNDVNFPIPNAGKDPIIGQTKPPTSSSTGEFARTWGDASSMKPASTFPDFVTMKGGEYFFAPSIPYLLALA